MGNEDANTSTIELEREELIENYKKMFPKIITTVDQSIKYASLSSSSDEITFHSEVIN